MCGIIGYNGKGEAIPVLVEGLKKMEYRGYDSSGVAVLDHDTIKVVRASGKIKALEDKLKGTPNSKTAIRIPFAILFQLSTIPHCHFRRQTHRYREVQIPL